MSNKKTQSGFRGESGKVTAGGGTRRRGEGGPWRTRKRRRQLGVNKVLV